MRLGAYGLDLGAQKLGTVRLGMSTEQLQQDIDSLRDRNTVLGVGFLFIGLVLSLPLLARLWREPARVGRAVELSAIAIAASCEFTTPIGYQTNTMVYGPAGYRFGDYWRLGAPLTLAGIVVVVLTA